MTEVYPNLFVGTVEQAKRDVLSGDWSPFWCVVNLASTFHYELHHWRKGIKEHPCYVLCAKWSRMVSMNWVDGPAYLYDYEGKGVERFKWILEFIHDNIKDRNILITCNQAISRSPAVALLYLAKYAHAIPDTSYLDAKEAFLKLYPTYQPGGIEQFISEHWSEL